MATLRFRYASPTASHGAGGYFTLTYNADHSVGAGHVRPRPRCDSFGAGCIHHLFAATDADENLSADFRSFQRHNRADPDPRVDRRILRYRHERNGQCDGQRCRPVRPAAAAVRVPFSLRHSHQRHVRKQPMQRRWRPGRHIHRHCH